MKKKNSHQNLFQNIIQDSKEVTMDSDLEDENYRQKVTDDQK